MNGKGDQTVNKQFEVKRISTKRAYNAAKLLCRSLELNFVYLADQRKDELIKVSAIVKRDN